MEESDRRSLLIRYYRNQRKERFNRHPSPAGAGEGWGGGWNFSFKHDCVIASVDEAQQAASSTKEWAYGLPLWQSVAQGESRRIVQEWAYDSPGQSRPAAAHAGRRTGASLVFILRHPATRAAGRIRSSPSDWSPHPQTRPPPSDLSRATTPWGPALPALAPEVTPTDSPGYPPIRNLVRTVDEIGRHAAASASSRRRLELELLGEPTTSTTSHCRARSLTASWRFWVA